MVSSQASKIKHTQQHFKHRCVCLRSRLSKVRSVCHVLCPFLAEKTSKTHLQDPKKIQTLTEQQETLLIKTSCQEAQLAQLGQTNPIKTLLGETLRLMSHHLLHPETRIMKLPKNLQDFTSQVLLVKMQTKSCTIRVKSSKKTLMQSKRPLKMVNSLVSKSKSYLQIISSSKDSSSLASLFQTALESSLKS